MYDPNMPTTFDRRDDETPAPLTQPEREQECEYCAVPEHYSAAVEFPMNKSQRYHQSAIGGYYKCTAAAPSGDTAAPKCGKCGYVMCQQFDSRPVNAVTEIAIPNGRYVCYHCADVEPVTDNDARALVDELVAHYDIGIDDRDHLAQRITAYADQRYVEGLQRAAKEVCDGCDNEERYGPAHRITGSTRWWHGDDNIPCEAGGIHALLVENNSHRGGVDNG